MHEFGFLGGLLEAIRLHDKSVLHIVQVGANDGVINDPLYSYVRANPATTRILLIEPQPDQIPLLAENYQWHDGAVIAQVAIGGAGTLRMYRIKEQFQKHYRGTVASGITSANRDHVLRKAVKNYQGYFESDPGDYIEEFEVECMTLAGALQRYEFGDRVDLLQVDTEGYDDEVIYHSGIPELMPSIVNYEFIHLSPERLGNLRQHLLRLGYRIVRWSNDDECAIRNR